MPKDERARPVETRVIRPEDPRPEDREWLDATMEERIDAVWTLTLACLGWEGSGEPRLQRSIVRIRRPRR